ncbi:MAG TPA: M20/M25/M40 family metallo-hydrolase [Anaerolineaceae bacterium]|nr:M20/M25/M40 family metallo-hydrolase [Anaerolineaceae bacterium]
MKPSWRACLKPILFAALIVCITSACGRFNQIPADTPAPIDQTEPTLPPAGITPTTEPATEPTASVAAGPQASSERLFGYLEDLTAIQAYSGWRTAATEGESQAVDYVTEKLQGLDFLQNNGLELERQTFNIFLTTEIWQTSLELTVDGKSGSAPVSAMRGHREDLSAALRFDSDGQANDTERNPVDVSGSVVLVSSPAELLSLAPGSAKGKVVIADYALFDQVTESDPGKNAYLLLQSQPAGILLVTQFSNEIGVSHGTYAGEGGIFAYMEFETPLPILFSRVEDLAPLGIQSLDDLGKIEAAHMVWDADVRTPAVSTNLMAHIPGKDASRALIISAHIDSANAPGAMDDGSGTAALLETAAVLSETGQLPPVDLYLVWFGSEEAGLYGSGYFAATHQELLDRAIGVLQIDCLTRPLDGIDTHIELTTWPVDQMPNSTDPWSESIHAVVADQGIETETSTAYFLSSDNSSFSGYDVPNTVMTYENTATMDPAGGVWYAGHIHDPYDTVELTRDVSDVLVQMAQAALTMALQDPKESYRVSPAPEQRAVIVATHTEPIQMTPSSLFVFGMQLAAQGFDVDLIPYGQAVTPADLEGADLVFALPAIDYQSAAHDGTGYDESWTDEEITVLRDYVAEGGFLLVSNSANRLKYYNIVYDPNEDRLEMNALVKAYGVEFQDLSLESTDESVVSDHPLVKGIQTLTGAENNAVAFDLKDGEILAEIQGKPSVALVEPATGGEVLVVADLGIFGIGNNDLGNTEFFDNLAEYVRGR